MGRRKIEIQPITNERNRSVTFLKRKTGLFKKAYELGVLCSVDVAVIIFERRHGHPDKLFQYCSGDVDNIVQRHLRFEGDRDTRTPHDFSGGNDARMDDVGDEDEDADADDSTSAAPAQRKRQDSLKTKAGGGGVKMPTMKQESSNADVDYRHLSLSGHPSSMSPTLPISSDRHTQPHPSGSRTQAPSAYASGSSQKRQRTGTMSSEDRPRVPSSSPISAAFPYRIDADQPHHTQYDLDPSAHLSQGPYSHSHSAPLPTHTYQHTPFFPSSVAHQPAGILHSTPSFQSPGSMQPPPLLRHAAQPGAYQGLRTSHSQPLPRISQPQQPQQPQHFAADAGADDIFAGVFGPGGGGGPGVGLELAFLEAPLTFDWPQQLSPAHPPPAADGGPSWLDFLSGNTAQVPQQQQQQQQQGGDGGERREEGRGVSPRIGKRGREEEGSDAETLDMRARMVARGVGEEDMGAASGDGGTGRDGSG